MISIQTFSRDGSVVRFDAESDSDAFSEHRRAGDVVAWVDLESPTDDDWRWLESRFSFHPLALEDARRQGQRAKVDAYDDHLFVSFKAASPTTEATSDIEEAARELDVFVGADFLVSVHAGPLSALDALRSHRPTRRNTAHGRPGYLLYRLLDTVVDELGPWMDALDDAIDRLEESAHGDGATPDLRSTVRLKRQLLHLRQMVSPLRDVVNQLLRIDNPELVDPSLTPFLQDVYDHTLRLVEQVDLHRDILGNVVDFMMAQTSNHLNAVMKTMTSISTILMIDALVAGIYGMNFRHMPELGWAGGYYACLGLMALLSGGLAWNFKRIGWL